MNNYTQQFIEKAIEGGWNCPWTKMGDKDDLPYLLVSEKYPVYQILLDPKAWEAVGKVEGWEEHPHCIERKDCSEWLHKMHRMIDHLADGGDIESYFKQLLS